MLFGPVARTNGEELNRHSRPVICATDSVGGEMTSNSGGLFLGPVRRPLKADSDFFVAGNTNRELLCKISVFSIMIGGGGGCDAMDLAEHQQSYACMFQDCSATFSSFQRVSLDRSAIRVQLCPAAKYIDYLRLRRYHGTSALQGSRCWHSGSRCCSGCGLLLPLYSSQRQSVARSSARSRSELASFAPPL